MDENRLQGKAKQAKGKIRETVSDVTGDESNKLKGKLEQAEGKIQEGYGKVKDEARAESAKRHERDEPDDKAL